jgi:hypothetical protein
MWTPIKDAKKVGVHGSTISFAINVMYPRDVKLSGFGFAPGSLHGAPFQVHLRLDEIRLRVQRCAESALGAVQIALAQQSKTRIVVYFRVVRFRQKRLAIRDE